MFNLNLTIVIPSKNEEEYIGHLLDDLQMQFLGDTPIYIADCSTDNTRAVIEEHKGRLNVKVIEGGPVSEARNKGAKLAESKYLLFIDADVRFFQLTCIARTCRMMEKEDLHLLGLKAKCYDDDRLAILGYKVFNFINKIMSKKIPFAVGAYMLTRTDKFREYGGFPEKYKTSEDFFLSKMYDPKHFKLANHYFGQDSRRLKKMGYFGMAKYLIKNFINRDNTKYWEQMDGSKYWD